MMKTWKINMKRHPLDETFSASTPGCNGQTRPSQICFQKSRHFFYFQGNKTRVIPQHLCALVHKLMWYISFYVLIKKIYYTINIIFVNHNNHLSNVGYSSIQKPFSSIQKPLWWQNPRAIRTIFFDNKC